MNISFDTLTVIVLVNVVVTIALWLESTRRPPQPKLKRKFIKQLSDEPITPKHQPPKTPGEGGPNHQLLFDDFADFANVINHGLAGWSRWRLQELPETDVTSALNLPPGWDGYVYTPGRNYAVFYNQAQVGKLGVAPDAYHADHPGVTIYIHLDYARLLPFDTIREFLRFVTGHTFARDDKEYFQAQQTIDRAMTEALWRSNQLDVQDFRLPDTGKINLRLSGIASRYLESREFLRNQATSKPAQQF
jgi:hypothetical protein